MKTPTNYLSIHHCALVHIFIPEIRQSTLTLSSEKYIALSYTYKLVDHIVFSIGVKGFNKTQFNDAFIILEDAMRLLIHGIHQINEETN